MRIILAAAVILLCSPADATQPYEGAWATNQGSCSTPDDTNLRIVGNQYYEHEGSCTIKSKKERGGRWTLAMSCKGEGEKWNKVVILEPQGDKMKLGGDRGLPMQRCRATPKPPNWPQ